MQIKPEGTSIRSCLILALLIFSYVISLSFLSVLRYNAFNAGVDLYHIDNTIWNAWTFGILQGIYVGYEELVHRFAVHVEPIFYLLSPLYGLWNDPRVLLLFQSLVMGIGALPVFLIAKEVLKSDFTAIMMAVFYLLFPIVSSSNLFDFHGDTLSIPLLLFSFLYLIRNKMARYFIFLGLALLCKEYVGLVAFMLGLYIIIWQRTHSGAGIATAVLGVAWFYAATQVITPYYNKGAESMVIAANYAALGGKDGLSGLIRTIISEPLQIAAVFNDHNLKEMAKLLLPTGGLIFWGVPELLISVPIFMKELLHGQMDTGNHRLAVAVPFIVISCIYGIHRLDGMLMRLKTRYAKLAKLKFRGVSRVDTLSVFLLVVTFLSTVAYTGTPLLSAKFWNPNDYFYWNSIHRFQYTGHDRIADELLKKIAPGASVMATGGLMTKLGHRKECYRFPRGPASGMSGIEYIAVDILEDSHPSWNSRERVLRALKEVLDNPSFGLIDFRDGLLLFRNGATAEGPRQSSRMLKALPPDIARADGPSYGGIRYLGHKVTQERYGKAIRYYWEKRGTIDGAYLFVDLLGKGSERVVHLPSFVQFPMSSWPDGTVFEETIPYINREPRDLKVLIIKAPISREIVTNGNEIPPGSDQKIIGRIDIGT